MAIQAIEVEFHMFNAVTVDELADLPAGIEVEIERGVVKFEWNLRPDMSLVQEGNGLCVWDSPIHQTISVPTSQGYALRTVVDALKTLG